MCVCVSVCVCVCARARVRVCARAHTHNTLTHTHTHTHQEADLEFFTDEALKEAGIAKAIARAKMLRQIRDHFNLNPKP